MSSPPASSSPPSAPVGIARSPRRDELIAAADANAQSTLAAFLNNPGGISPPPNIPPRVASFSSGSFRTGGGAGGLSSSPAGGVGLPSERSGASSPSPAIFLDPGTSTSAGGQQQEGSATGTPNRGRTPLPVDLDTLPDEEKARVLRRHLVHREIRGGESNSASRRGSATVDTGAPRPDLLGVHFRSDDSVVGGVEDDQTGSGTETPTQRAVGEDDADFPIPYSTPGGDITHSIYKWQSNAQRDALKRTRTTSLMTRTNVDPRFEHIHEPGGFRRNYLLMKADDQGEGAQPPPMLNNFIDFLYLFGHFGGEDLEDEEDLEEEEEVDDDGGARPTRDGVPFPSTSTVTALSPAEAGLRAIHGDAEPDFSKPLEQRPLLGRNTTTSRSLSRRARKRSLSTHGAQGDATVTQAILMLLKSFIGTGILFLGKAFFNGGILFSALTLAFIALISLYSFNLLVYTKFVVSGSFGDLGGQLYGKWMRFAILSSIVVSQLGFVAAYTIFIASNFQAFILAITNCKTLIPIQYLIFAQTIVLLPLSLIRNLAKLSGTALIADAFILVGLVYIASQEFAVIAREGIADVELFNPRNYPLLVGTAVFSFEGIGLVIPITDSMREPRKFPGVLSGVMIFLMFLFGGAGTLSYLAYGSSVQTVILVNLPADQKFVQVVQFLYASAILLSTPLQLFPAIRIMETKIFKRAGSGKTSTKVKWEKNAFRAATVLACYCVAWIGASDLDKFVSFIGSFACIPLCYVYPAMLHYRACARTRWAKAKDIALMVFGLAAAVFTTVQTVKLMFEPSEGGGPEFGTCSPAGPGEATPLQNIMSYVTRGMGL